MLKPPPQSALLNPLDDFNLLDDAPPPTWTGDWVSRRLVEGFKTLRQLPLKGAALGFKNTYWVAYSY